MTASDKKTTYRANTNSTDMGEMFVQRFNVVKIYVVILLLLAASIVWSGIKTAESVQQYHQDYKTLQDMKKQQRKLQVEHQRLLIEQQTFSATPQIASRAVAELGMYSPTLKDKLIIQPGAPVVTGASLINNNNSDNDDSTQTTDDATSLAAEPTSQAVEDGL